MDFSSPWPLLAIGLLLVLTPVPLLFPGNVKYRTIENLEITLRNRSWWRMWRNVLYMRGHWIELARAYVGMRCLVSALELIRKSGTYPAFSSAWMVTGIALFVGILALGLMIGAFRPTEGAFAPVAFVSAAICAVVPLQVTSPALILAISSMVAFKSLAAFFSMLALGLAALVPLFGKGTIVGAISASFAATPVMIAFLMHRQMVISVRQSKSDRPDTPR